MFFFQSDLIVPSDLGSADPYYSTSTFQQMSYQTGTPTTQQFNSQTPNTPTITLTGNFQIQIQIHFSFPAKTFSATN